MEETWYYATHDADPTGPVSEDKLNALVACGHLRQSALVWSETMNEWAPFSSITRLGAPASPTPIAIGYPTPAGLGGWLQFVGIMHIISGAFIILFGVLSVVTLIGPFFIVPFGVLLVAAGTACTAGGAALPRMTQVDFATNQFLGHIKRYMAAYGILFLAHFTFTVLGIIMLFFAAISSPEFGVAY